MKLATLKDGSRDGLLVVVSRDLAMAHHASGIASRLQHVLDDWNFLSPQLEDLYATLNGGKARHAFPFEPRRCMAPLPRAFQWVDGAAYPSHRARVPDAGMARGASDALIGACDEVRLDEDAALDAGAMIAVAHGDLPAGASVEQGLEAVRLLLLAVDWRLRDWRAGEPDPGTAGLQARVGTAFAPVAVTPDELGADWRGGRAHMTIECRCNDRRIGRLDAADGMATHFGELLAALARTRPLRAGGLVGGGVASVAAIEAGAACLAELRALEAEATGEPRSGYLRVGDRLRVEATGSDGASVFGAVEQAVAATAPR